MLQQLVAEHLPETLASFQPIRNEPEITQFNKQIAKALTLVFPRIEGDDLVFASGKLAEATLGIREPDGIPVSKIDLILVPALAVDQNGIRLGRGKGYYDRALSRFPNAKKIAVIFDEEFLPAIPADPWDIRMDGVVTPKRRVMFG